MRLKFPEMATGNRVVKVAPFLLLALMTGLLWLPFGLQVGYYMDEWQVLAKIQAGQMIWLPSRPFLLSPWLVAYLLAPNSFLGTNLVLMLLIMGKVMMLYLILRELEFNTLFAFGTAVVALFYPADTGVFFFSGLTIHFTVVMYLLAVWLFIRFWKTNRLWLWIPIVILTAFCVGSYEATYPLFLIVPLVLVYQKRGFTRRIIVTSAAWLVTPFLFGLLDIAVAVFNPSAVFYQTSVVASDNSPSAMLIGLWNFIRYTLVDSWWSAFTATFLPTGWHGVRNALKSAFANPYLILAMVAVVILVIGVVALWKSSVVKKIRMRQYFEAAVAGLIFLCLSLLVYLPTALRFIYQRTLLFGAVGTALTLSVVIWLVGVWLGRVRVVYTVLLAILLVPAIITLLVQHSQYAANGYRQTPFMQAFVRDVPQLTPHTTVVLIDNTPDHAIAPIFTYYNVYFDTMLQMIYSDPTVDGMVCYLNDPNSTKYYYTLCHFEVDEVQLTYQTRTLLTAPYNQLLVFQYDTEHGLQVVHDISPFAASETAQSQYNPDPRFDPNGPLPLRAHTMLGLP